jgi:hypothetical protein
LIVRKQPGILFGGRTGRREFWRLLASRIALIISIYSVFSIHHLHPYFTKYPFQSYFHTQITKNIHISKKNPLQSRSKYWMSSLQFKVHIPIKVLDEVNKRMNKEFPSTSHQPPSFCTSTNASQRMP